MHSVWVAVFLAGGGTPSCGGQGLGVWRSTNDGATWTIGNCAHVGNSDDRESMWVDNNPASPFYGRIYVTWNDFAAGQGLYSVFSTDGGVTWSAAVQIFPTFRRDVQVTTDPDGDVFLATMDEGGGGLNGPRVNWLYRSTNGGVSWSAGIQMGPSFLGPGRATCGPTLLRRHVHDARLRLLPPHGLGRHRRRPGQRRSLRVRLAPGHGRSGRRLLRPLVRQRRHLERSAEAEHGRDDARTVACPRWPSRPPATSS